LGAESKQDVLCLLPDAGQYCAMDILKIYKEQHGIEKNFGFLKDPLIVNDLFLKKT